MRKLIFLALGATGMAAEQTALPDVAGIKAANSDSLIDAGIFRAERLVNMSKHDYRLEPNVTFSPDMKWVIFRSNIVGPVDVYAVEIANSANQ